MSDTTLQYKTMLDASGFASGAQQINSQLGMMGIQTSAANANLGGLGTVLGTLANPLTAVAFGITAVGGALVSSVQSAAAWESAMVGVAKTTGLSGPALEGLSSQLLEMSTNMPVAAADLANIAQVGGSLGIATDQLAGFTEVAAKMGVGFEMSAEQAATSGAKILNAFGQEMDTANLEKLGSVVNTMGDSFAATEPQVLDFLNRASFLNTTMGQSIPQVAALGTTLISAGMEAEVASTGIKSALNILTSTTSKTGGMDNWAKLMGVSVDELKGKIAGDLNSTLIETADKIAAMEDPTERFQAAVAAAGTEGAPAILKLAGATDDYAKALGLSNSEWDNAQSLQRTYDAQMESVNSKWTIFTNTLKMASTELGTGLLPAVGSLLGFLTDIAKIGIKVGKTLSDAVSPITSAAGGLLSSAYGGSGIQMGWESLKNWAGIGTEHAEQMAKEISENDKLKKSAAEALETPEAKAAMARSAKGSAEDFATEWAENVQKQTDAKIASILARSAEANKGASNYKAANGKRKLDAGDLDISIDRAAYGGGTNWTVYIGSKPVDSFTSYLPGEAEKLMVESLRKHAPGWELDEAKMLESMGMKQQAAELRAKSELALDVSTDLFIDFGKNMKVQLEGIGKEISDAFAEGMIPDVDKIDDALENLRNLKLYDPEEAKKQGADVAIEYMEALKDAIESVDAAKARYILEPDNERAKDEFLNSLKILDQVAKANPIPVPIEVDTTWLGTTIKNLPSIADIVADPSLIRANFDDIVKYVNGYFLPAMSGAMDDARGLFDQGMGGDQLYDAYVRPLHKIEDYLPIWLSDLMAAYEAGQMEFGQFLDSFDTRMDKATKAIERQSVGYDNLKAAIGECADCAISDFGAWQEAQDNLFQGSYIGPGGKAYLDWKKNELQAISDTQVAHAAANGGVLQATMHVTLDSSKAWQDAQQLVTDIAALKPVVTVTVNLQPNAYALQAAIIDYVNQALAGLA